MNCSRFRFNIQQRFDVDIAPQEERMVTAHLESCESCAKFHHQLQQVIMAAEEVPLPEEMQPNPPEALARQIMEGLPQPKGSPFDFITKLFAKKEKELPTSISRGGMRGGDNGDDRGAVRGGSKFPHRSSAPAGAGKDDIDSGFAAHKAPGKKQREEDHSGTSNRLKALAKNPGESLEREGREAQSTTRSLGEKLGFAAPAGSSLTDEQPLTLAESIRRKVSETKPADQLDEEMAPPPGPQSSVDDGWGPSPAGGMNRPPANLASPPVAPKQIGAPGPDNGQTVLGTWGKPTPIDASNNWGGGGQAAAQAPAADDWGFDPSASGGQQQQQMGAPGGMDPFAPQNQQGMSNPNIAQPSGDSWGGWNDNQAPRGAGGSADSDWGPPPQGGEWDEPAAANNNNANNWGGTPNPIPNASAQPQPKPAFGNGVMETGMIKLGELGLPSMQQQQMPGGAQPGQMGQMGQAPFGAPAPNQQGQSGGQPAFGGQMPGQAPQPVPGNAADPWGGSSDNWGAAPSQDAWGTQGNQAPAAPGGDQWGQPAGHQGMGGQPNMGGQPGMGSLPGGMGGAAPTGDWGTPSTPAGGDSWGAAPVQQNSWGSPAQGQQANSWNNQAAAPADAGQSAWGDNDWGAPQQQQAPQPTQAPSMQEPAQTSSQAAALGKGRQQAWSLEAEQVETGTWRAFAPAGETLSGSAPPSRITPGPTGIPNQQSFAPQPQDEQSRWDVPIQERMKQQQSGTNMPQVQQPAPAAQAPANPFAQPSFGQPAPAAVPAQPSRATEPAGLPDSPAPTKSGWNFPVYEAPDQLTNAPADVASGGMTDVWGGAPAAPEPAKSNTGGWDMPSAANPSFGSPMQAPAAEAKPQSPWDTPIQERQQPQAPAASPWGQAPEQAPTANPAQSNSPWGQNAAPATAAVPSPFAAPQSAPSGWGEAPAAPAPAAQAPASGAWDSPAASGWGTTPATAPGGNAWDAPAQAPTVAGSWGTPGNSSSGWGEAPAAPAAPVPALAPTPQPAAASGPQGGGLFQNLDDSAIDRLFSENLGVNDSGATSAGATAPAAPAQPAPTPAFSTPRWNPAENAASAPGAPSFSGVAPSGQMGGAAASPFGAPQQMGGDSGAPKISAITPRGPAQEAPVQPGVDRRSGQFGAPPVPGAAPNPVAPESAPAPVPAAAALSRNGLFNLDDSAMDELFSKNLGINESATPSNSATSSTTNAPVFQQPAPAMVQQPATPPANPFSRPAPQLGQSAAPAPAPAAAAMPNPFASMTSLPAQQPPQPSWGQQPPAPLPAPTGAAPGASGGLFSIDDSMIDKIFADNAPAQPTAAAAAPAQFNVNEAVKEVNKYAEVAQVPPPKIAGVGRLDPRMDTSADSGSGRIASIGKFLLDQKDLEKIGKLTGSDFNDTKMRILTMEAAQELQTLLHHIGTQETVVGSVIVGHDGLLIANTMPSDIDAESIGVWALGLYMSTEMVIKKMGQDRVHQIVSRTPKGYVVIADFGGGLLVTVSDGKDTDTLIPLMRSITQLVAQ